MYDPEREQKIISTLLEPRWERKDLLFADSLTGPRIEDMYAEERLLFIEMVGFGWQKDSTAFEEDRLRWVRVYHTQGEGGK